MAYFGLWADPDAALAKYLEQKDDLHAGRAPRPSAEGLTVKELCNAFLNHKRQLVGEGGLSPRSFTDYKGTCDLLVEHFGKLRRVDDLAPEDFAALRQKAAKRWGPVRLGNAIQRTRSVFKYALDAGLTDRPVRFGPAFKRPAKKSLRLHRAKQGAKLFAAEEVRRLVKHVGLSFHNRTKTLPSTTTTQTPV
jgi:hypothetical protein